MTKIVDSPHLRNLLRLRQQVDWEVEKERARLGSTHRRNDAEQLLIQVAAYYLLDKEDLISHRRSSLINEARQVCMWLIRQRLGLSYPQLGAIFNRDHTTAMHAVRKVDAAPRMQLIAGDILGHNGQLTPAESKRLRKEAS